MVEVTVAAAKLTIGALEISVLVGTFLYAITCAQIYVYWRSNFNDRFLIRLLVRLIYLDVKYAAWTHCWLGRV